MGKQVLLAPFSGFGHFIPFAELGRRLANQGHSITILIPSGQRDELRKRDILRPEEEAAWTLVDIAFQRPVMGPKEQQGDLNVFGLLGKMLAGQIPVTQDAITRLYQEGKSEGKGVDVVVIDHYLSPAASTCQDLNLPYLVFNTGAPLMALSLLTITDDIPADDHSTTWPTLRTFAQKNPVPTVMKTMSLERKRIIGKGRGFILNSFRGLADQLVDKVRGDLMMDGAPIFQLGPLFEEKAKTSATENDLTSQITRWLDKKPSRSVIYISFGTVATPTPPQLAQLTTALLALQRPFIWSLQAQYHDHVTALSAGMGQNQTDDSPFLVLAWSPQKTILNHDATGAFVSHCGWNSTLESLAAGKPLVGWPMFSDQYLNAEWLQDEGIAVMVKGTGTKAERVVPSEEIAKIIEDVASSSTYTDSAQAWKRKIAAVNQKGGSYHSDFEALLTAVASKSV